MKDRTRRLEISLRQSLRPNKRAKLAKPLDQKRVSGHSYIEKVANFLVMAKAFKEAEQFLTKADAEETNSPAYHRVSFMVAQHTSTPTELMNRGRQLVFAGLANAEVYRIVVQLFAQAGKETMAESIIARAVQTLPELRAPLYAVLEQNLPKSESSPMTDEFRIAVQEEETAPPSGVIRRTAA